MVLCLILKQYDWESYHRHHMVLNNGIIRDTVVFSITQPEWPQIKSLLKIRLEGYLEARLNDV